MSRFHNEYITRLNYIKIVLLDKAYNITGYALIDHIDFEKVYRYKWALRTDGYVQSRKAGLLHRLILNASPNLKVDHKKRGMSARRDCRRQNIRIVNNFENSWNSSLSKRNSSGRKGVYWNKLLNKWRVEIMHNGKRHNLGLFSNIEEAATAYDAAAIHFRGAFAVVNKEIMNIA